MVSASTRCGVAEQQLEHVVGDHGTAGPAGLLARVMAAAGSSAFPAAGRATGMRTYSADRSGKIALPAAGRRLRYGARPRR
jgi:hypothetical protein